MKVNRAIMLVCIDLGFGVFDRHFTDMPKQCVNTSAAEQAALDMSVGLALSGKIPFVYSITPFLLYRPFETLRTYINHENIPVKLIGAGRDFDYAHDGMSHHAHDAKIILQTLPNIKTLWPKTKEEIPHMVEEMIGDTSPYFLSLRR